MSDIYSPTDERAARVEQYDADRIKAAWLEIQRARATCMEDGR